MSNLNETLNPFGKFCMTIGHLPSSYMLSLSYEEQVLWFCDFLEKKVIPAIDNNAEAVKEIQDFLKTLDLQDEVNNKLDEMAENGELESLIAVYLQSNAIISFDTVQDMVDSELLVDGSTVRTLGYYELNDGGGATYKIVNDPSLNTDNSFVILLQNDLKAKLIYNSEISILQLGARSQKNNIRYDIHDYITKYITKNEQSYRKFALFIPQGIYYTSPIEIVSENYKIYGVSTNSGKRKPTILSAWGNQEYIIKCGSSLNGSGYGTIENITFSSALYDDSYNRTSYYTISNACLVYNWVYYMTSNYLCFEYIVGSAFKISTSWELWFSWLDFYHINAFGKGVFIFDEVMENVENGNLSDCSFNYLRFEQLMGDCIVFKENCKGLNLHFGTINVEPSVVTDGGTIWNDYTTNITLEKLDCVVAIEGPTTFIIDNIQLNNFYWKYYTLNNLNYVFGDIIQIRNSNIIYQAVINTIALYFANNNVSLIRSIGNVYDNYMSKILVNNVVNNSPYNLLLNIKNLSKIELKSPLSGRERENRYITQFGSMIPCYKNIYNNVLSVKGLLNYDENSVNPEKVVITSNNELTGIGKRLFGFLFNSRNFYLRAKIEDGQSLDVAIYGYNPETDNFSKIGESSLLGTGDYERYEITLDNKTKMYGSICYFQIVNNNESTSISLDTFSN